MFKYYIFMAAVVIIILSGCAGSGSYVGKEVHEDCNPDSLKQTLIQMEDTIDSLYYLIGQYNYTIDSLNQALEISNSRIAIHSDFIIPDSIIFAGRTFKLTNERIFENFEEIFNSELKSAHKFIPRSGKYFPVIDSIFSRYDIPFDTRYLAIAESSLSPLAKSRVGAVGLWQFMESTAKGFGLKIDSFIDERRDVFKSTDAAARLLQHNYNYLADRGATDWLLAMSAYNAGAGSVSRTIKQQGGYDFFELIMKSDESNKYVWRALAIKCIFDNEEKIFGRLLDREKPLLDQVRKEKITLRGHYRIDDWAVAQGTVVSKIWELNPWIKIYQQTRQKYSPVNDVVLPPGEFTVLVPREAKKDPVRLTEIENLFMDANAGYFTNHTVKKGDTLYEIAKKYKTTVAKIKSINNLSSNIIHPGQKLKLFDTGSTNKYYVVASGDSVSSIASKLGTTTSNLVKKNNLKYTGDIVIITPGQKLYY